MPSVTQTAEGGGAAVIRAAWDHQGPKTHKEGLIINQHTCTLAHLHIRPVALVQVPASSAPLPSPRHYMHILHAVWRDVADGSERRRTCATVTFDLPFDLPFVAGVR